MQAGRLLFLGLGSLLVVALALALYLAWPLGASQRAEALSTVDIDMGNFWFCDSSANSDATGTICTVTINVGDSVTWTNTTALTTHTATHCADDFVTCSGPREWDTGFVGGGTTSTPQGPFNTSGTFIYRCQLHPLAMRATLIVQEIVGGTAERPDLGDAQTPLETSESSAGDYAIVAGAIAAGAMVIAASAWHIRRRWPR